ncbi:putative Vascular endothelial growth factor B protein [Naja naja]|nr:putative Vascular endothelial growth factor B protein [Naja naja]
MTGEPAKSPVIRFLEVYNRSACQPRETMVSVMAEHPSLRSHIMIPSCVALRRCTGCCSDDSLDCVPSRSREAILEVRGDQRSRTMLFRSNSISRSCAPCRDRKKQPDPQTCKCVCRHQFGHCERRGMKFSERTCRCAKHRGQTARRRVKPAIQARSRREPSPIKH